MATYTELYDLRNNEGLANRITVAVTIKSQEYIDAGTATATELSWAKASLQNPRQEAEKLMPYVLAANKAATVAQIEARPDAQVQTNTNAAIEALIGVS